MHSQEFLIPEINDINFNMLFQQDGTTAHTAMESIQLLETLFSNRLISRFGDVPWSSRSSDMT